MSGWVAGAIVVGTLISTVGGSIANSGNRKRKRSEEKKFDEYRKMDKNLNYLCYVQNILKLFYNFV